MKYYEITTTDSAKPNHIEDNTIVVKANDMHDALLLFKTNRGDMTLRGQPVSCREVWYVREWELAKHEM